MSNLTKEECLIALELIKESYGEGEFQYNYDEVYLLEQLINEHFDNPPLKWEELHEGMWVWDIKGDGYIEVLELHSWKAFETHNYMTTMKFEENRFYRKQVE